MTKSSSQIADLRSQVNNWLVVGSPHPEGCRLFSAIPLVKHKYVLLRIFSKNKKHHNNLLKIILRHRFGISEAQTVTTVTQDNETNKTVQPRLREDWPFLKDPDCPPELKILVADKITAFSNVREAHRKLSECKSANEQYSTVRILVENYIENYRIYNELKCYKATGKILGKHSIWLEMKRLRRLRTKSPVELPLMKKRLEHNLWRIRNEIAKGDKPHLRTERETAIKRKSREIEEIERLIASYK